jgi:hypothetical protein
MFRLLFWPLFKKNYAIFYLLVALFAKLILCAVETAKYAVIPTNLSTAVFTWSRLMQCSIGLPETHFKIIQRKFKKIEFQTNRI